MFQQGKEAIIGTLIVERNVCDSGRWLGLVVNQEKGMRWVERDPCIEYLLPKECGPLLVRVLGQKQTSGSALGKKSLPEQEPHEAETVRWAFVQTIPNLPFVIAGPDVDSIAEFRRHCEICNGLGMRGTTFLYDLTLLEEYLSGVKKTEDAKSYFERKFFSMLEDVLPR